VQRIYEQFDRSIDLLPGSVFPANDGDWPWLVSLFRDGQFLCEGTLIEDQWILTSGSCFDETASFRSSSQWVAVMGTVRLSSKSQLFAQERDILSLVHSRSDQKKHSFNLSLLKMEHAFNASDYVRHVCVHQATLSSTELRKLFSVDCYSTAWDVNNDRLQFVKANIIERDECEVLGEGDGETREMSFCVRIAHLRDGLMTVSGRALYCATSSNIFSVVGVEAAFDDVTRRKKVNDQSTSLHLFIRTTHHSEWIRQIVDSFKRNAAAASEVHEVRISPADPLSNQNELTTARQPVYQHDVAPAPISSRTPDLNWSPDKSL
jgi:serine protease 27